MLNTPRLTLTPMSLNDAPFVHELVNSRAYIENIGKRDVRTVEDAEQYIQEKMVDHFTKHGYGNFLMTRREDGVKVGCVSLYNRDDVEGVDIGFALMSPYFRMGYAYEGASFLRDYAFDQLDLETICAFTSKDNIASQGLIEKLGLRFLKTIIFGSEKEELLYYEKTK